MCAYKERRNIMEKLAINGGTPVRKEKLYYGRSAYR